MNDADTFINYMIDLEATGKNIRTLMKMTGYTARELEKLIGCTQMTFFNWCEGRNLPGFDNLLRLAGILKTPMEKIVVFKKFTVEDLPLKDTNSGFIRNNVFFTYNRAVECLVRDCLTFKKKFGVYPDQLLLSSKTLENCRKREHEEKEECVPEFELSPESESITGELVVDSAGKTEIKTPAFSVQVVFKEEIPENYYRLIDSQNCKI